MKITIKPVLWTKDIDSKGDCPIALSISGGGSRTYYNTKIKCPKDSWDGRISADVEHADILNITIEKMVSDAKREILNRELQGQSATLEDVKMFFNPKVRQVTGGDFMAFYRSYIDNLKATNKKAKSTIALWESEYKTLKTIKGEIIPFKAITADFLNSYHKAIMKYGKADDRQDTAPTTLFKKLKKLRQIIKNAIDRGLIDKRHVAGFEMVTYKQPEKNYLTLAQTEEIGNAIYSGKFDKNDSLKQVACYFLISCYSGLRVSDWDRFTVEKLSSGEHLKVTAQKNKEPIYIPLKVFTRLDTIVKYVKSNNIKFTVTHQAANRLLEDIRVILGFDVKLHNHLARTTCATMLGEMGYSAYAISQILGITENTAKIYRKTTRRGLEREYEIIGGL